VYKVGFRGAIDRGVTNSIQKHVGNTLGTHKEHIQNTHTHKHTHTHTQPERDLRRRQSRYKTYLKTRQEHVRNTL